MKQKITLKKNISYNRRYDLSIFKIGLKLFQHCFSEIARVTLRIIGCSKNAYVNGVV